jgi:hypothetical protein
MEYTIIKPQALGSKINGRIKTGGAYVAETCNVLFNCIYMAVVHNDATWLNKGAAYARASGPYITAYMSVAKTVSPFKFDKEFGGKVLKPKRDKWRQVDEKQHGDYRDERWFQYLEQKFEEMLKDRTDAANRKNKGDFDLEKWLKRTIAKAEKEGCIRELIAAANAVKEPVVQEVAQGIANEEAEEKAAARKAA